MIGGSSLFQYPPPAFGLDIGDRSIKMAMLRAERGGFALESIAKGVLEAGIMDKGKINNERTLARRIRDLMRHAEGSPIKNKFVVASLPEEESFIRVVQIPVTTARADFDAAVRTESESNIPLYLNEVYLDWQVIGKNATGEHFDVLIVAVRKSIVDSYLACIHRAKLQPVVLEVESFGITRALIGLGQSTAPVFVVDLGSTGTSFIVYSDTSIRFTVTVPFRSDELTSAIAETLHISYDDAEALKAKIGLDPAQHNGDVARVLHPKLKFLIQQIQRYVDFYNSHPIHEHGARRTIERIILSGGGAELIGLDAHIAHALKLPVSLGNPWLNILSGPLSQVMSAVYRQSTHYTTALGLALRGITFTNEND